MATTTDYVAEDSVMHRDIVMFPLHVEEGTTVRITRFRHTETGKAPVFHAAGGPYKGIYIMRPDDANPSFESDETRDFIAYVTDPYKNTPYKRSPDRTSIVHKDKDGNDVIKEKRELRFWFYDQDDSNAATADFYLEQLLRKFPKGSIPFVKRLITQLRLYPEIRILECEMRPMHPGEEDQLRLTRKQITRVITTNIVIRQRRKPAQEDMLKETKPDAIQNGEEYDDNRNEGTSYMPYGAERQQKRPPGRGQDDWNPEEEDQDGVIIELVDTSGNVVRLDPNEMREYRPEPIEEEQLEKANDNRQESGVVMRKRTSSTGSRSDEEAEKPKRFSLFRRSKRNSKSEKDKDDKQKKNKKNKRTSKEDGKPKRVASIAEEEDLEKDEHGNIIPGKKKHRSGSSSSSSSSSDDEGGAGDKKKSKDKKKNKKNKRSSKHGGDSDEDNKDSNKKDRKSLLLEKKEREKKEKEQKEKEKKEKKEREKREKEEKKEREKREKEEKERLKKEAKDKKKKKGSKDYDDDEKAVKDAEEAEKNGQTVINVTIVKEVDAENMPTDEEIQRDVDREVSRMTSPFDMSNTSTAQQEEVGEDGVTVKKRVVRVQQLHSGEVDPELFEKMKQEMGNTSSTTTRTEESRTEDGGGYTKTVTVKKTTYTTQTLVKGTLVESRVDRGPMVLSARGRQILWACRKAKVLAVLEDAYPNVVTIDTLMLMCGFKLEDRMLVVIMLDQLGRRNLVEEIDKGKWARKQEEAVAQPDDHDGKDSSSSSSSSSSDDEDEKKGLKTQENQVLEENAGTIAVTQQQQLNNELSAAFTKKKAPRTAPKPKPRQVSMRRAHKVEVITVMPTIGPKERPSIAIVTLLYCEKVAVDTMMDCKTTYVRFKTEGEGQVYTLGVIGDHHVVSTKIARVGHGEDALVAAGSSVTRLLGTFNSVNHVFLVGVAGGVPNFIDDTRHVRLGDIVVSRSAPITGNLYMYCKNAKPDETGTINFDTQSWHSNNKDLDGVLDSRVADDRSEKPNYMNFVDEAMTELQASQTRFYRPSAESDKLYKNIGEHTLEVPHPEPEADSSRAKYPNNPTVHYGMIGAGSPFSKEPSWRTGFATINEIRAIDCGFKAALDSVEGNRTDSVAIVRGISDYEDGMSRKEWQPYAALAAAAYTKSLILDMPSSS